MTDPTCTWVDCGRLARVSVTVGPHVCGASRHGAYCVPHSALASRALQFGSDTAEVWFDWVRPGEDVTVDPDCTCVPPGSSIALRAGAGDDAPHDGAPHLRRSRTGPRSRPWRPDGHPRVRGGHRAVRSRTASDGDPTGCAG